MQGMCQRVAGMHLQGLTDSSKKTWEHQDKTRHMSCVSNCCHKQKGTMDIDHRQREIFPELLGIDRATSLPERNGPRASTWVANEKVRASKTLSGWHIGWHVVVVVVVVEGEEIGSSFPSLSCRFNHPPSTSRIEGILGMTGAGP